MQNTDKIVVAKPVPSRPYSRFSSFSELLAGTIHASPPPATSETVVAIRPKTVRFKPSKNQSLHKVIPCPQSDLSESTAYCARDENSRCKPDAKFFLENPAALMENVGNDYSHLPHKVPNKMSQFQLMNQEKSVPQNMEQDTKCQHIITNNVDRPCYDGYSWRKYGQKQVKGSNHPRSYYKCTYPTCPMKKKVEKSFDGKIAEIVYEGEHNHPKPQPPKRLIPGSEVQNFAPQGGSMSTNGGSHDQINYGGVGLGKVLHNSHGTLLNATYNQGGNLDISTGLCGDDVGSTENIEERRSKRRKNKEQVGGEEHILSHTTVAEHGGGSLLQSSIEPHVLGDGFRWRKYGQKAVKGNSYPRSYYKCTNLKCTVRKHVERAADDPSSFITTYEGKHNHQMPDTKTNSASASDTDMY